MRISTARVEEARVEDSHQGFHCFIAEDGTEYGSFEVLWIEETKEDYGGNLNPDALPAGWYWQPCFPGCIPDAPPSGPFSSSINAYYEAQEV